MFSTFVQGWHAINSTMFRTLHGYQQQAACDWLMDLIGLPLFAPGCIVTPATLVPSIAQYNM
jgi:hypothetical protein